MKYLKSFLILVSLLVGNIVVGQYYYFDTGGNIYQQGCNETLNVKINANGKKIKGGRFHLILDPSKINYNSSDDVSSLRNSFQASTETFVGWASDGSPSWQPGSSKTILQVDRSNQTTYYNESNGKYITINFSGKRMDSSYNVDFSMEYDPNSTTKTVLSLDGGINAINQTQQYNNITGTITVLQAPCTADSDGPTITIKQVNNADLIGKTKISYLSGIKISFTENGGVKGKDNVPYVFTGDHTWIDNPGYSISNQYGVDKSTINLTVSCTDCKNGLPNSVDITGGTISWNSEGKTWEYKDLNYDGTIDSSKLFDFGIEKEITINGYVYDNPRVTGLSDAGTGKKGSVVANFTFNTPVAPTVSFTYPNSSKKTYINLNENIEMYLDDDWAGVSGDSIVVTLSGIDNEYRGVFSGDDLQKIPAVSLSGANTSGYNVTVLGTVHEIFPTSGTIKIIVSFVDNEGESVDTNKNSFEFSTRPPCSELGGCCNPVEVDIVTGSMNNYSYTYYRSFTGGLLVSGNYQVTSGWAQNESGEWIGTGTLICQTSGLSLYSGSEEDKHFLHFTDGETLTISGNNVVAEFSGNQLILRRASEVTLSTIYPTVSAPRSNFDFEWGVTGTGKDSLSGYKIELYSGECGVTDPIWSGYFEGSGTTTGAYTGSPLTSLQQYCWKVSAMQGNRVLTGATATFTGMMEIIVKADMGFSNNTTKGALFMYNSSNHNVPLYSGVLWLGESGTGIFIGLVESGCYDVVFKSWNHLASYILGACTVDGIFDFTNSSGLYNNTTQQIYGDMPAIQTIDGTDKFVTQDYAVNGNDYSAIYSALCGRGNITKGDYRKVCDIDGNNQVTSADAAAVVNRLLLDPDPFYHGTLFSGFEGFDYDDIWNS